MVKKSLLFFLLVLMCAAYTASANCGCPSLRNIAGEYTTIEVTRYRGGLTSSEEAERRIGESAKIADDAFSLWGEIHYEAPIYEVTCHLQRQEEGEVSVPSERWGSFYGFGVDRKTIVTLDVAPSENNDVRWSFEFVGNELWAFFDGWFYRMKRELSADSGGA